MTVAQDRMWVIVNGKSNHASVLENPILAKNQAARIRLTARSNGTIQLTLH